MQLETIKKQPLISNLIKMIYNYLLKNSPSSSLAKLTLLHAFIISMIG